MLISEIFSSIQGEGNHVGTPATFIRFSGCSFRRKGEDPICPYCDTDFTTGAREMSGKEVMDEVLRLRTSFIVLTGGEPTLQVLDGEGLGLIRALEGNGFFIAMETNGAVCVPKGLVHWLTVSPKVHVNPRAPWLQQHGDELKVVYNSQSLSCYDEVLRGRVFKHYYLQPEDGLHLKESTKRCVDKVMELEGWRLSLQTHKLLGLR